MRECGGIGRHDGLKIRCLVINVRVQVPPLLVQILTYLLFDKLKDVSNFDVYFQIKTIIKVAQSRKSFRTDPNSLFQLKGCN